MSSHEESHSNNFKDHFHGIYQQEYKIDGVTVLSDGLDFFVQGQEAAINHDNKQDESIKPRVNSYKLNDLVSEWIRNR